MPRVPVTLGVAVRYEPPDRLRQFVRELADAAHRLDATTEAEVCVCLNGASGDTRRYLADAVAALSDPDLRFTCIESPPGKIRAHEAIARRRELRGYLAFVDADVRCGADVFLRLYEFLDVHACYGEVEALPSVAGGLFGRLQDAYYRRRRRLGGRPYLHGRCFMLRDWLDDFAALHSPAVAPPPASDEPLGLHHGPIVDDVHYSRVLVHRFGPGAISPVPGAAVRFVPPDSPAELRRDSFRTELELVRLDLLFPEHAGMERSVFNRRSDLRKVAAALARAGLAAAAYVGYELMLRRSARRRATRRRASLADGGISPD